MIFELRNENPILVCSMEGEANSAGNETAKRVMSERKGPINEERYVKSHSINFTANIKNAARYC